MIEKHRQGRKISLGWKKKFQINDQKISKEFMVKSFGVLLIKQKESRKDNDLPKNE
jgi:hypothetical protein